MTHTETLQEIQNNAGNPERVYHLTKEALARTTNDLFKQMGETK